MIQVFVPTIFVVVLSWFTFWLGLDAVPGRVTLLITCLLTIVTMHSSGKSGMPPVNYVKVKIQNIFVDGSLRNHVFFIDDGHLDGVLHGIYISCPL